MFANPSPWWIAVFFVFLVSAAMSGETVPIGPALVATLVLFAVWRVGLEMWDRVSSR